MEGTVTDQFTLLFLDIYAVTVRPSYNTPRRMEMRRIIQEHPTNALEILVASLHVRGDYVRLILGLLANFLAAIQGGLNNDEFNEGFFMMLDSVYVAEKILLGERPREMIRLPDNAVPDREDRWEGLEWFVDDLVALLPPGRGYTTVHGEILPYREWARTFSTNSQIVSAPARITSVCDRFFLIYLDMFKLHIFPDAQEFQMTDRERWMRNRSAEDIMELFPEVRGDWREYLVAELNVSQRSDNIESLLNAWFTIYYTEKIISGEPFFPSRRFSNMLAINIAEKLTNTQGYLDIADNPLTYSVWSVNFRLRSQ